MVAAADNTSIFIFAGVLALLLLFVVLNSIRNGGMGGTNRSGGSFKLRRTCRDYGLDTQEYRILKTAIKKQKLGNPAALFTNGNYLNGCLKKIIKEIDGFNIDPNQKETLRAQIFDLKQKITMNKPGEDKKLTTQSLPANQPAIIQSRTFPPFHAEIVGKTGSWVVMELPRDSHGDFVQYKPGERVKVQFVKEGGKVYSFVTTVNDLREVEGEMRLLLDHTDTVKKVQLRKSPRKDFQRPVFFYKVEIIQEGSGRKAKRQASVNKSRRYSGTMLDISAGGCAVLTRSPLPKGEIVMVAFDISSGNTVNVFGKIRNLQRDRSGTLMRMAFTKVSTKTMNSIKSLVFGFEDEEEPQTRNKYLLHG